MTYKQLPIVEIDLDDLELDLKNYRIPTERDDEAAALKFLFASEKVLEAAKMILRDGYFDNEVPIVIPGSTSPNAISYVVLEGNRRVSALKALQDPKLVPSHKGEIGALLKRYALEAKDLPTRIRVLVAPNRATAAPHVARLHTGRSKRPWSRDQQATFYYSLLDSNTTVDDIRAQYPGVSVPRFIRMAAMRRLLTGATFTDHSLREYAAGDELRMSVFEYAYAVRGIALAIGVTFDKNGHVLPTSSRPEKIGLALSAMQLANLEYLVGEFRAGRLNTRSPEFRKNSPEQAALIARLDGDPDGANKTSSAQSPGSSTNASAGQGSSSDSEEQPNSGDEDTDTGDPSSPRGPNHPDSQQSLDLSGLDYGNVPLNLKLRYFELRRISVTSFPIATTILMRSVLESTIKVHYETANPAATGQLKEAYQRVAKDYGSERSLRATINTVNSGGEHRVGSIQWFNHIAHSADASVAPEDVRAAWKLVNPILRRLLRSKT